MDQCFLGTSVPTEENEAADVLGDAFTVDIIAHIVSFINTKQNDLKEAM